MTDFLGLSEEELRLFLDEMTEHLETLETELLALEQVDSSCDGVAQVFRAAHTIKGAAATVGLNGMARVTHAMETILDSIRAGKLTVHEPVVTVLLEGVDYLRVALLAVESQQVPGPASDWLLQRLDEVAAESAEVPIATDTVNLPVIVAVQFAAGCQLPSVRALQVLLALKGLGEIGECVPSEETIRAGQAGETLRVTLHTASDVAAVNAALARISDLASVELTRQGESPVSGSVAPPKGEQPAKLPGSPCPGPPAQDDVHGLGTERTIRVDVGLLDDLMNLVGELVIDRGRLGGIGLELASGGDVLSLADELGRVTAHLARVSTALQETVLKARMLPVQTVFKKFPRMVRDVARQVGKKVDFRMEGGETELDRSVLEVLGDPLMHLLRNSLDHGLEELEEREAIGKPVIGVLQLSAGYEENEVVILVQDDGRGLDPEKVKASAVRKGIIGADRAREISDQEAVQLIFAPGFSTREETSALSGRGVGLDVVRRNIERVGGRIEVESQKGYGCIFRLLLPLTLATVRALLVRTSDETLALPLSATAEVLHIDPRDLSYVGGRWVTQVRGRVVPVVWLQQLLKRELRAVRPDNPFLAVLVNHKGQSVGLVVDRLIGEQEVVVKGLGAYLGQIGGISGVTILGDGSLALILDINGLVEMLLGESRAVKVPSA